MCAEWRAGRMGWNLYRSTSEHHSPNEMFSWGYLGPCLTPAEVDARMADALKWRNAINDYLTQEWHNPLKDDESPYAALKRILKCELMEMALDPIRIKAIQAEIAQAKHDALKWRDAINAALTNWLSPIEDHETPKDALQRLVRLEIMAALDPKVSKSAADLVAQARREALAECIAACEAVIRLYRVELPEKYKFKPEGIPFEWEQTWEGWAEIAEDIAAAIRALSDTPTNMVLVPREPTSAMIYAGGYALQEHAAMTMEAARIAWDAMVKAAGEGDGDD